MVKESSSSDVKNVYALPNDGLKITVTPKYTETWEVIQLNTNLGSPVRPSDLFQRITGNRKARHEAVLRQMAQALHRIHLKAERHIEISSNEVKAHIIDFEDMLVNILKSVDNTEVKCYDTSVFLKFQKRAEDYKKKQQKLINELFDDLNKFENERANENAKLLQLTCEEIRKIGYFLPFQVQNFVEHETLKMNQVSLCNRRCFDDSRLTLTLVTEQMFKSFVDKVFCIQSKWFQQIVQQAYFNMQQKAEKKVAKMAPELYTRLEIEGHELLIQLSPDNLQNTCKTEEWAKNVEEILTALETYGKNLIGLYKKTVHAVFHYSDAEMEEIKKELNCIKALAIEERVIKPIIFEADSDEAKEIENLEVYWQETLCDIRTILKDVTEFLLDAGKLWDGHTERICESKKVILKALEKAEEDNEIALEDLEIKLNVAVDILRQEHSEAKLEKYYLAVIAILESMKSKYESIYLSQVSTIEDYFKMMTLEADVLSAEIKEFIYATHTINHPKNVYRFCDECQSFPNGKPIFREIQICVEQIKAVKSWKQGVWTALETFAVQARNFLKSRAEIWVQSKITNLADKMSIQIELTKKRCERIKVEIYEKRLEEIICHEKFFQQHKEAIQLTYQKIKDDLKMLTASELRKLNQVMENFNEIESSAKLENRPGIIHSNHVMLERKKEEMINDVKCSYEGLRAEFETRLFDSIQANTNFMKSIKLFHEDGNYSAEEGKMFATMLEAVDKELNMEFKNVLKGSTKEENDLIKKVSLTFDPTIALFSALYEETFFNQELQTRINDLTRTIRNFAAVLKSDFELLNKYNTCLRNIMRKQDKSITSYKYWCFILKLLYRNISNMFYPVTFSELSNIIDEKDRTEETQEEGPGFFGGRFSLKATISKTPTFRTPEIDENFNCKDYKKDLFHFEDPPENDGSFMAVICNSLWSEMDSIQKIAFNFYRKLHGRKIIREDLIPINYEALMNEILKRFQSYNNQCEELWLQIMLDLLPVVSNIKIAANCYFKLSLDNYESETVAALKSLEEDFLNCLQSQSSYISKEFITLDKKLLALHGHPQNGSLLGELEEEIIRRTAGLGIKWENSIKKFKSHLKCFRFHHIKEKREINKIQEHFLKLRDRAFNDYLGNNILNLLSEYLKRGGFWSRRTVFNVVTSKGKTESEDLSIGEMTQEYDLKLNLITEKLNNVLPYFIKLNSLIERERDTDSGSSDANDFHCVEEPLQYVIKQSKVEPCERLSKPKINILLQPLDCHSYGAKILEKLDGYCKKLKALADSQVSVHEDALFRWLSVWKLNVKKIEQLYVVTNGKKKRVFG